MPKKNDSLVCSFCGRREDPSRRIVPGPGVAICNHCIQLCRNYLSEYKTGITEKLSGTIPTPAELKAYLDEYVIGQEKAKRVLSVAVYNHYKRIMHPPTAADSVVIEKSNVLLIGPTGSGKTLLARTLAQKMKVPFAIADATTLTEAGYVGEDVENILLKLIQNADGDISRAEQGIIFIDEIDKIARKSENVSITRDVSGEGVQQALLKIVEGTIASVPPQGGRKHPNQDMLKIDTSNILFICGGAFVGLDTIVQTRVKFGIIPELIGRLPISVALNDLKLEDLRRILVEPKNAIIKQFQESFKLDNVKLSFDDDALDAISQQALDQNTGARGLRSIVEKLMLDAMFEAPSLKGEKALHITKKVIDETEKPELKLISEKTA